MELKRRGPEISPKLIPSPGRHLTTSGGSGMEPGQHPFNHRTEGGSQYITQLITSPDPGIISLGSAKSPALSEFWVPPGFPGLNFASLLSRVESAEPPSSVTRLTSRVLGEFVVIAANSLTRCSATGRLSKLVPRISSVCE